MHAGKRSPRLYKSVAGKTLKTTPEAPMVKVNTFSFVACTDKTDVLCGCTRCGTALHQVPH